MVACRRRSGSSSSQRCWRSRTCCTLHGVGCVGDGDEHPRLPRRTAITSPAAGRCAGSSPGPARQNAVWSSSHLCFGILSLSLPTSFPCFPRPASASCSRSFVHSFRQSVHQELASAVSPLRFGLNSSLRSSQLSSTSFPSVFCVTSPPHQPTRPLDFDVRIRSPPNASSLRDGGFARPLALARSLPRSPSLHPSHSHCTLHLLALCNCTLAFR